MKKTSSFAKVITALLMLSMLLACFSCDIMKKSQKTKEDLQAKENFEQKLYRPGDSVNYRPQLNVKYKDTTIYRVTKNNTRLETVYDSYGNIRDINCYSDKIEELTKKNSQLEYQAKEKAQEKKEEFDSSFILYIIIGVVVLGAIALLLLYKTINQNSKAIEAILKKIS